MMLLPRAIGLHHDGVTIRAGDRVTITAEPAGLHTRHGWFCWRETLVVGAVCDAVEDPFYAHDRWNVLIRPRRAWSVHDKDTRFERRFWCGNQSKRPEGFLPSDSSLPLFFYPAAKLSVS